MGDYTSALQERLKTLEELFRISGLLADETHSLSYRLQTALDGMLKVVGARTGSIMLVENGGLVVRIASNEKLLGIRRNLKESSIATEVIRTGTLSLRHGLPLQREETAISHYTTDFSVSLPLFSGRVPVGVVNITDKAGASDFLPEEIDFLENFKKWIEILLENSRLKKKLAESVRKTSLDIDHPVAKDHFV